MIMSMPMLEWLQELHNAKKLDIHCLITKRVEDELYPKGRLYLNLNNNISEPQCFTNIHVE